MTFVIEDLLLESVGCSPTVAETGCRGPLAVSIDGHIGEVSEPRGMTI